MAEKKKASGAGKGAAKPKTLVCGLVMPISAIDGCSADHWVDVKSILAEAIEVIPEPSFKVKLVSDADDVGVIQKRIVENVYSSDIVVCDVSGKNPNVMFELGMRLAFDKPTVIVTDDKTDYAFDTGVIEHISYPRDLRFNKIVAFKAHLADKVVATHKAATNDPDHSTFLKSFGKFSVANLEQDAVPADKLVVEMISELQAEMSRLRRTLPRTSARPGHADDGSLRILTELARFLAESPDAPLMDLLSDEAWADMMEGRCAAPHYFRSPEEFREALAEAALRFARFK